MTAEIITIERLAFGGAGFGHLDGKACFVPFAAPGDKARIKIIRQKRSYCEGELLELLEPAACRISPPCPIFGVCGGCNWQHIAYPEQLAQKENIFADLLWRIGRVERDRLQPIVGDPNGYGYRSRIQLKVRWVAGALIMGFFRHGSHFVVDLPDHCPVAHPAINGILPELRSLLLVCPEPDKIPQVDLMCGENGETAAIFHYIGRRPEEFRRFLQHELSALPSLKGVLLQSGRKDTLELVDGIDSLSYQLSSIRHKKLSMNFTAGGFAQVNYRQNRALLATVCEWSALTGNERLLDLYCGNGNFSLPLADSTGSLVGLENYAPSIRDAQRNAKAHGLENTRFICTESTVGVQELLAGGERFDLLLLDPPRTGAGEALRQVQDIAPKRIIYISCDPATLARDISLLNKSGYNVAACRPFDMFPQTYHLESVTLLEMQC